ncbi:MAG: hypothetical protein WCT77_08135 [Bacteroidota bacterium]
MSKSILVILVGKRNDAAVNVQKILTGWGCTIKTRLGIHDGVLDNCSDEGLIILELVGTKEQNDELLRKLNLLSDVKAELVTLTL